MSEASSGATSTAEAVVGEAMSVTAAVALALFRVVRSLRRQASPHLGYPEWSALVTISEHGPLTLTELAEREGVQVPSASRAVSSLRNAGLITCRRNPGDQRKVVLATTEQGAAAATGELPADVLAAIDTLDADDTAALLRAADTLTGHLRTAPISPHTPR
ncbi:MarR family winged helix-turn-helix transcriptional regulator [Williamsia sterculiae]|uniref:DNA-binding transcriptional regulator, MarR family n=1 Tax=Williamsia sterculiae TaxID=1344003 RepID=A0A1N7HEB2_9NOCA|nr:MarR family transcriptional regulator [Williamsia sterculiae]SIS23224.1 DNA-binding transcriptional regulator, MarR family [Williamsia sterculiae]